MKWDALENDYMLLEIRVSKDENEITRLFAFTEREQEIIRVRVGEIAKKDDIVECIFNRLLGADAYLQGYGASEEITLKIVKELYEVMQYESIEELLGAIRGEPEKVIRWYTGKWGEWKFIQMIHEYGIPIDDYQVKVESTDKILDVILKKHPFEVKYWDWGSWTEEEKTKYVNDLLDELENGYKVAYENPEAICYHQKAFLSFVKELPQDGLEYLTNKIREKFGEFENWLEILNGEKAIQELLSSLR